MSNHPLFREPNVEAALRLLTASPEAGGTRTQIDKWIGRQEDPEMVLLAMVARSQKVRRHVFVRLTGLRSRPNDKFSAKPWETFFCGWVGQGKLLGTRERPGRLTVEEALTALVAFRAWKGDSTQVTPDLRNGLHDLAVKRHVSPAEVFVIFTGRWPSLDNLAPQDEILQAVGRSLTSLKAAATVRRKRPAA